MKELKCNNCGATIHTDGTQKKIVCNYCGTEYKDNLDYNININMNDNTKEIFNSFNKNNKFSTIIVLFIFMFTIPFIMLIVGITTRTSNIDYHNNIDADEFNREYYNSEFEYFNGEQSKFFVDIVLDRIIARNNEGEHIISVYYQDVVAVSQTEIQTLLKSLEDKEYYLSFIYSTDGYINSLVIED